jgi:acyl carrier protein
MGHIEDVRRFVVEQLLFGDGAKLDNNTSFSGASILDSTGILELIMFLEGTYNIKIADNELIPENLDSITKVAHFLEGKLNGQMRDRIMSDASMRKK